MLALIEHKIAELRNLCKEFDVARMYVFGSASSENFTVDSDIDLLISFKDISFEKYTDNYFDLHEQLELLLEKKVDLITERSLTNPYFIASLENSKKLIYVA
jgi:predicted nucleotidyltransferase